jgi:hypothetical protein
VIRRADENKIRFASRDRDVHVSAEKNAAGVCMHVSCGDEDEFDDDDEVGDKELSVLVKVSSAPPLRHMCGLYEPCEYVRYVWVCVYVYGNVYMCFC